MGAKANPALHPQLSGGEGNENEGVFFLPGYEKRSHQMIWCCFCFRQQPARLVPPMPKRNQRGKHSGCPGFNPSGQGVRGRACPVLGGSHAEGSAPRLALSLVLTWLHASGCYSPPVSVPAEVIYIRSCKLGAAGSWLC